MPTKLLPNRAPTDPPLPAPYRLALHPRTIAVIRLGRLGDVLLCTPTIRALRNRFPDARLVVLTRYPALFASLDDLTSGQIYSSLWSATRALRALAPDLVVDLQRSAATAALGRLSGAPVVLGARVHRWHDRLLTHAVPPQRAYAAHYLGSILRVLGVQQINLDLHLRAPPAPGPDLPAGAIGLAPGASSVTRAWPEARWIALARQVRVHHPVVVIWGPPEAALAARVAAEAGVILAPPADIPQMTAQIRQLRLLVGNCSAPRHLAVSQRVPTVTLHGASPVGGWTRPTPWHVALHTDLPCRPCNQPTCPIGVRCLAEITEAQVLAAVEQVLLLGPEPGPLVVPIVPPTPPVT